MQNKTNDESYKRKHWVLMHYHSLLFVWYERKNVNIGLMSVFVTNKSDMVPAHWVIYWPVPFSLMIKNK